MYKKAEDMPFAAGTGPDMSWAQLFNPFSQMMGGGDRYPEFMASMFPGKPRAAWLVSKIGAVGLLAAAIAGTTRGIQHIVRVSDMADEDDPAKKMRSEIGTTFNVPLAPPKMKKTSAAQSVLMPGSLGLTENTINNALPIGAFILAGSLAWGLTDKLADKRRNRILTEANKGKSDTVRRLIQLRARIAKGLATDDEIEKTLASVNDEDNYIKTAAQNIEDPHPFTRKVTTGLGLLLAGLGLVSAAAAYRYFRASDPDNLRYKAMKRGLRDYARNKSFGMPISVVPNDSAEFFASLEDPEEAEKRKKRNGARGAQEIEAAGQPVEVKL